MFTVDFEVSEGVTEPYDVDLFEHNGENSVRRRDVVTSCTARQFVDEYRVGRLFASSDLSCCDE